MKFFLVLIGLVLVFLFKDIHTTKYSSKTIAIQPLGKVRKEVLDSAASAIRQMYGFKVIILPKKELPSEAFVTIKSPRYRADKLIAWLRKNKPASADHIIGITEEDISTTKRDALGRVKEPEWLYKDFGIMGLGYCPGISCVVSTFRLHWEHASDQLFLERVKKVATHEMGHNLSLPHCEVEGCVMNSAKESIKTIDKERMELCEQCKKKIRK